MMFLHLTSSSSSSSSSCTSRLLLSVIIIYSVYFSSVVLKVQCQDAYQDEKGNDFSGDDIDNEARRLQESKKEKSSSPPPLLVISLDGFRYDYLDRVEMKSLKKLSSNGVHATNGMKGIFSTITFPSHWTLATGLFEESHGIVANKFYDPIRRDTFNKSRTERFWWGGEPIWATAKKQGKKVGVYFWPGSNVDFGSNSKPDYWFDYNISVPLKTRTEAVTRWLTKEKIDLAMMYYHEPDKSGHGFGYMSDMVVKQLQDIDNHLVDLFDNLSKHSVNIIVLSDHGMVNETSNPETKLDESVEELSEHISWSDGVITHFWPKKGKKDKLLSVLRSTSEHYSVYEKEDIPKRWRYRNNPRIGDVITVADEGYFVSLPQKSARKGKIGRHGYDNDLVSMRPLFMASGPDFKRNYKFADTISMINVYSLFCGLMRIDPAPNNGSLHDVYHILRRPLQDYTRSLHDDRSFNSAASIPVLSSTGEDELDDNTIIVKPRMRRMLRMLRSV